LENGNKNLQRIDIPLPEDEFPRSSISWFYRCTNLYEYFTVFSRFSAVGIDYTINRLEFVRTGNLWIDEASIQQGRNQRKTCTTIAVEPVYYSHLGTMAFIYRWLQRKFA